MNPTLSRVCKFQMKNIRFIIFCELFEDNFGLRFHSFWPQKRFKGSLFRTMKIFSFFKDLNQVCHQLLLMERNKNGKKNVLGTTNGKLKAAEREAHFFPIRRQISVNTFCAAAIFCPKFDPSKMLTCRSIHCK